jgi:hypothetical protein
MLTMSERVKKRDNRKELDDKSRKRKSDYQQQQKQ